MIYYILENQPNSCKVIFEYDDHTNLFKMLYYADFNKKFNKVNNQQHFEISTIDGTFLNALMEQVQYQILTQDDLFLELL